MRLLVIEDDSEAAAYLVKAFREQGHLADHAGDGIDGYARAAEGVPGHEWPRDAGFGPAGQSFRGLLAAVQDSVEVLDHLREAG